MEEKSKVNVQDNNGQLDKEALEEIAKRVELGIGDEREMRRTELNFYCELHGVVRELNKALEGVYQLINYVSADKLTAYFKELTENYKKEETRVAVQNKIAQSHKKKSKK